LAWHHVEATGACAVHGAAVGGAKGVHRLLLVQDPNPRTEPYTEPSFTV